MSNKMEEMVQLLSGLSVLEMAELKTALENKWGVKAAAAATVVAAAPAGEAPKAAAESSEFQVILAESAADKKIGVIK